MPLQFGRGAFIKLGEESTYGNIAGAMNVDNRIISASFQKTQEKERKTHLSQSGGGGFQNGHFEAFLNCGGSIDLPLLYEGTGMLIKAAVGNATTSGSGPYEHLYIPTADGTVPALSVALQRGTGISNSKEIFLGCKVASMSISGSAGEEITASFEIIAQDSQSRAAALTSSFGSGKQMFHFECGNLSYSGNSFAMKSFEFTLDNKLERRNVLGDKKTLEPVVSDVKDVTLSVTLEMEDNLLFDNFIAGTQSDAVFTLTNSDGDACEITIRNAYVVDYDDPINTFGPIERSMTFVGESDAVDEAIQIKITNQQASAVAN